MCFLWDVTSFIRPPRTPHVENPELNVPVYLIIPATDNSCLATSQWEKAKNMESATNLLSHHMGSLKHPLS